MIESGVSCDALSIASCPFAASPQISTSLRDLRIEQTPLCTVSRSSTTKIRSRAEELARVGAGRPYLHCRRTLTRGQHARSAAAPHTQGRGRVSQEGREPSSLIL